MRHASGSDGETGGRRGQRPLLRRPLLPAELPALAANHAARNQARTRRASSHYELDARRQRDHRPARRQPGQPSTRRVLRPAPHHRGHARRRRDLDAFITRQAATTTPTTARTSVIDGTAALPSDLRLTKRQRRIHVSPTSLAVIRAGGNRRKAHGKRERRWRTVITLKQALATFAVIGVLAGISVVVSGALSGSNPERATLTGRRPSPVAAVSQSTVIHSSGRRTAPTKRNRAAKTSHRVHRETHKAPHSRKHSTPPATSQSGQAVDYVQKPAATTPSIVEAPTSSTGSSEPTAASASVDHATRTGPTGAGAPFAPGAQVK